jgi:hypothetical protein
MPLINIISPDNGFGNGADIRIVEEILKKHGYDVKVNGIRKNDRLSRLKLTATHAMLFRGRYDLNVFLGPIFGEWIPFARRNAIIPNVECFRKRWRHYLPCIDLVIAKTRVTEKAFNRFATRTRFVSFTSGDKLDERFPKSYSSFLHLSSGWIKGTRRMLETWRDHPEWPCLTALVNRSQITDICAENIHLVSHYVPRDEIAKLLNHCGIHLCLSEAEGFGHYIVEAMSTRAVTATTDGPPMNELVQPGRGLLVDVERTIPWHCSDRHFFDKKSLEKQVARILTMCDTEKAQIGFAARDWFLSNDRYFREAFPEVIKEALA